MDNRGDIYQRVTDQIIAAIEAGADKWQMPWHAKGGRAFAVPYNAGSGKPYRGINTIVLWATAQERGYSSPVWATYKQWAEKGAQVRKGEKATGVVFWKIFENGKAEGGEQAGADDEGEGSRRFMARAYSVFNAAQVEGYQAPQIDQPEADPEAVKFERIAHAEQFLSVPGVDVRHGGSRAFYSPTSDHVQLPAFADFVEPVAYYATRAHELVHATSHKTRCDRQLGKRFGDAAYAAEELIAELGAAFLCGDLGLAPEPRPDHAAYIATWLKVLREDKRAIFTAASKAQQAADWMHAQQPAAEMESLAA
jgi:antirestriction protein ArdC